MARAGGYGAFCRASANNPNTVVDSGRKAKLQIPKSKEIPNSQPPKSPPMKSHLSPADRSVTWRQESLLAFEGWCFFGVWCFVPASNTAFCEGMGLWLPRVLQELKLLHRRSAHAPKTAVIGVKAGVGVAGSLTLAKRGAAHIAARLPGTAARNPFHVLAGAGWPMRIGRRTLLVVSRTVNVLAPFRHVSVQVEDAPAIRLFLADVMSLVKSIVGKPRVFPELVRSSEIVRAVPSGATGIFPFRFRRQAITVRGVVTIQVGGLLVVTWLQPFEQGMLVAI